MPSQSRQLLRDGEFWALRDISFELRRGDCLGLIGRNGAGKTTLLKVLTGLLSADTGNLSISGRVGALIALGAGFNPILTARENIFTYGAILGLSKKQILDRVDDIISFAELENFVDTPVRNFSSGMQIRLGFSVAANLLRPDLLILDEVLSVGDAGFKLKSFNKVSELMRDAAVIFVSHGMQEVSRVCNQVALLRNGTLDYFGNDVGYGVDRYLELFGSDIERTVFSKDATITDEKLSAQDHNENQLYFAQPFSISFSVRVSRAIPSYFIMLQITDRNMRVVAQYFSNNMDHTSVFTNDADCIRHTFDFQSTRLTNGEYYVTVFVIDPKDSANHQEFLAVYRNLLNFKVTGLPMFTYAPLLLDCQKVVTEKISR